MTMDGVMDLSKVDLELLDREELTRTDIVRAAPAHTLDLQEALKEGAAETAHRDVIGFRPLHDNVLVRRCSNDELSDSRMIHIPTVGQEKPMEGIVLAVGKGRWDKHGDWHPTDVQPGDRVLFGRYDGTPHKLRGVEVILLKESLIQGVLLVD
jgi:chaperonin GroES